MRRYITKLFMLGAFLFFGMAADNLAAGGNLDTGFNGSGKSVFNIESAAASGNFSDIAVIAGNKFLVAGRVVTSSGSYYAVTLNRFNSDGSVDTSFGSGGKVITDAGITSEGTALAVQSDGKIVVIGIAGNHPNEMTVVLRYTTDGVLDTTFGNNGIFFSVMKVAKDIAILADDKILIAGASDVPNLGFTQVAKLTANGSADPTFGTGGIASSTYSFGSETDKMAIQSDGKIVICGRNFHEAGLVHRFNTDGSPDTTFGTSGVREIVGPNNTRMYMGGGVAIQPDGKIVLAGAALPSSANNTSVLLMRLNSDGSSDGSFGTQFGMVFHDLSPNSDSASDIVLQSNGKIVVSGASNGVAMMGGFDSAGALDPGFGSGGITLLPPGSSASAIALQGTNLITVGFDNSGFFLARVDQAGASLLYRSESFIVGKNDQARDVAIQPDGKIVAAGVSESANGRAVVSVARLLPNGALDTGFGTGGRFALNEVPSSSEAYAVDIQPDGKIVVAGRYSPFGSFSSYSLFVMRLNPDGSLDSSFGTGGKTIIDLFPDLVGYDVELQPDGKIVVGGAALRNVGDGIYNYDMMAARLNPNGTPDSGFGSGGVFMFVTGSSTSPQHEQAKALSILPNGKIILAGTHLLRLNPDSTVDAMFSPTPVPLSFTATDIKLQPDGKILLSGAQSSNFALARYNANASIDTDFGVNGTAVLDFGGSDIANALYLDPNGDILAGGSTFGGSPPARRKFALARFKPNGSPDSGFGAGGKVITDFGRDAQIFGLARQSDGRIVAAGDVKGSIDRDYALARYLSRTAQFDFDGDAKTDISIYRPSAGEWWIRRGATGQTSAVQFGSVTDRIVPGDYTGDGLADLAVWRESTGEWFILRSEDNSFFSFPFGAAGDIAAPSDFDGDGRTDAAVFRPASGTWFILNSGGGISIINFGSSEDKPVPADFDGDGKADIAIWRPSDGSWWYLQSSDSQFKVYRFGVSTDKAVPGDYTGDGKADIAVWRPSTGEWFILRSEDGSYYAYPFGSPGDVPAVGDYDGDGKADSAVFRPATATWYLQQSTSGFTAVQFGVGSDLPVPSAFVR